MGVYSTGWNSSGRLDTRPTARRLEPMPAQHGQTYDPQEKRSLRADRLLLPSRVEADHCNIRGNPPLSRVALERSLTYAGAIMTPSRPDPERSHPTTEGGSLAWTLALTTALLGIVALPRRTARAGSADKKALEDEAGAARQTSPSHSGSDAREVARTQADRGRRATRPTEIPAKGWKDIALRTYRDIGENRIMLVSAGVTFFALLAIFPAIAALVSVYGLVADTSTINDQLASLQGILPRGRSTSSATRSRT